MRSAIEKLRKVHRGISLIIDGRDSTSTSISIRAENNFDESVIMEALTYLTWNNSCLVSYMIKLPMFEIHFKKTSTKSDLESIEGLFNFLIDEIDVAVSRGDHSFFVECFDQQDLDRVVDQLSCIAKIYPMTYTSMDCMLTVTIR